MSDFLTVAELQKITAAIPMHAAPDAEIKIVINEDRILIKDVGTRRPLVWIKRAFKPFWLHSPISAS